MALLPILYWNRSGSTSISSGLTLRTSPGFGAPAAASGTLPVRSISATRGSCSIFSSRPTWRPFCRLWALASRCICSSWAWVAAFWSPSWARACNWRSRTLLMALLGATRHSLLRLMQADPQP